MRRGWWLFALLGMSLTTTAAPLVSDGVLYVKSQHSVADTIIRAKRMLQYHELRVFGVVDHADEAKKTGGKLPPTQLLLFGKPQAGTAMMQANRLIGLDLPMKLLVWEDDKGIVWISYNRADYLAQRHQGITKEMAEQMAALLRKIAEAAAQ